MTSSAPVPVATVEQVLADLDVAWRHCGIPRNERDRLRADVAPDLFDAASSGQDPRMLLTPDIAAFADSVARANNTPRLLPVSPYQVWTSLVGAFVAIGLCLPVTVALWSHFDGAASPVAQHDVWAGAAIYSPLFIAGLIGGAVGFGVALRTAGRAAATLRRAVPLLLLAGAILVPVLILFARATHYNTAPPTVILYLIVAFGTYYLIVTAARQWALRGALD